MEWEAGKLLHGGDYNPEQWLEMPEILARDIELFREAKINVVTLGVFSWSTLEPEEGLFQFEWLEKIVDTLHENGIKVILATPSGARPHWMADQYPEVLRMDESRHRNLFGHRHNHCYNSPIYKEKVKIINRKLSEHFGSHPAVILWHLSNEYGGDCHCPLCQNQFREWLKEKYESIQELNRLWCTTFWSHTYQSFEQVESPSGRGETSIQALELDWKRFVTDCTVEFIEWETKALRENGNKLPTTANLMYDYQGLDYQKISKVIDVVSWDNYPTWHHGEECLTALDSGMQHDLMRSLKKKPYLLMESSPSSTNWQNVSKLRKPKMHEAAALQAIAHGSDSVCYFQLRQSRGAEEKFHGAVIDHYGGNDTRVFQEVKAVGEALEQLKEVVGSTVKAQVAIVYEQDNRWAVEGSKGPRNIGVHYKDAVQKTYNAFRKQGLNVDFVGMREKLQEYKIVAAPMAYLFQDGFADRVREYVSEGGTFILTYWSGVVDQNDRCFLGGTPHGLMEVFGLRSTEIDGLFDGEKNFVTPVVQKAGFEKSYQCEHLCELVELSGAEKLMEYQEDFYKGYPALTKNLYGSGKAYYICADMEQKFYDDLYKVLTLEEEVEQDYRGEIPEGMEVTVREGIKEKFMFIQNYSQGLISLDLPEDWTVLYGNSKDCLERFESIILKKIQQ